MSGRNDPKRSQPAQRSDGGRQQQSVTVRQEQMRLHHGPLPPPEQFAGYEQVLPGAADRILGMAEKEMAERHRRDAEAQQAHVRERRRGQWFAFLLGVVVAGGGIVAIIAGRALTGLAAVISVLAVLVGAFLSARRRAGRN